MYTPNHVASTRVIGHESLQPVTDSACGSGADTGAHNFRGAYHLMRALHSAGLRNLVISPGSRSTPLLLAALHLQQLDCHNVLDERSAGFFALGIARLTGRAVVLLCTSGSAAAHYLPAVVEAKHSRLPLVLLTADRPWHRQKCGSPQTSEQTGLFGNYVHDSYSVDLDASADGCLRALGRVATAAVDRANADMMGPVHINVHIAKALEPDPEQSLQALASPELRTLALPRVVRSERTMWQPSPQQLDDLLETCERAKRGWIVCGPQHCFMPDYGHDLHVVARRLGFSVICESTSQLLFRTEPALANELHLSEYVADLDASTPQRAAGPMPDVVIQTGDWPITRGLQKILESDRLQHRIHVDAHGWVDPGSNATVIARARPDDFFRVLRARTEHLADKPRSTVHRQRWNPRSDSTTEADKFAHDFVQTITSALPDHGVLFIGNSSVSRRVEAHARALGRNIRVLYQRGVHGIDGLIASAIGASTISKTPTVLLLGDVSAAHDIGSFELAALVGGPLVVLIVQNYGGQIFNKLPAAAHPDIAPFFDHWTRPARVDFSATAQVFGHAYRRVSSLRDLPGTLSACLNRHQLTVLELIEPKSVSHGASSRDSQSQEKSRT